MMTSNQSIFRRTYDALALFAVLNVAAFGGLAVYLITAGVVDRDKLRAIVDVLQAHEEPAAQDEAAPVTPEESEAEKVAQVAAPSAMDLEVMRREAARIKVELEQRLALNNSILLRVSQQREQFQQERDRASARDETAREQRNTEGFRKQVAILESLAPKTAIQHLLAMPGEDDAAAILLQMDTRQAKKIVEAAKGPEQLEQIKGILRRLREAAPDRSEELAGGTKAKESAG